MRDCNYTLRDVAPLVAADGPVAARHLGLEAWLNAALVQRGATVRTLLGWYRACDTHNTCDPSTHGDRAQARRWSCPHAEPGRKDN